MELERERELELNDFERNWNYKKELQKKELELNEKELEGIGAELKLIERN